MFQIIEKDITTIRVNERARQDLGDLRDLTTSIQKSGQLNPILITEDSTLIAGERRLMAMKELESSTILARIIPNISQSDQMIIELMENVARKDFSWHEELELKYKLHSHWKAIAEETNESWGFRETASELKCSIGGLSTDLTLAEAFKSFPELKEQDNKTQAKNFYKKLGEQALALQSLDNLGDAERERLESMMQGKTLEEASQLRLPQHDDEAPIDPGNKTDCSIGEHQVGENKSDLPPATFVVEPLETFIPKIPDNSVGFIELDPPYAIDFEENYGGLGKRKAKESDWTKEKLYGFYSTFLPILYNKLLDSSWVFCWTGIEHWEITNRYAQEAGFKVQKKPGFWIKPGGSCNTPKTTMISNYETFLLFRKGKATFNSNSFLSTIECPTTPGSRKIHQWEKPFDLYDKIFDAFERPGSIFLSPFAGSGNSMIIAAKRGMLPMGCDIRQKYALSFYDRLGKFFMEI